MEEEKIPVVQALSQSIIENEPEVVVDSLESSPIVETPKQPINFAGFATDPGDDDNVCISCQ